MGFIRLSSAPSKSPYGAAPIANGQLDTGPLSRQRDSPRVNSYSTGPASVTTAQNAMAGGMGTLVHKDHFHETYLAPQGKVRLWIHHVTLAPGSEHINL